MLIKIKIKLTANETNIVYEILNKFVLAKKQFLSNGKASSRQETLELQLYLQLIEIFMKKKMKLTLSGKNEINISLKYHEAYYLNQFLINHSIMEKGLSNIILKIDPLL